MPGAVVTAPLTLADEDRDAHMDSALGPLLQPVELASEKLKGPVLVLSLEAFDPEPPS